MDENKGLENQEEISTSQENKNAPLDSSSYNTEARVEKPITNTTDAADSAAKVSDAKKIDSEKSKEASARTPAKGVPSLSEPTSAKETSEKENAEKIYSPSSINTTEVPDNSLRSVDKDASNKTMDNKAGQQPQDKSATATKAQSCQDGNAQTKANSSEIDSGNKRSKISPEEDMMLDSKNAEDAEDTDNDSRHTTALKDYEAMSMENLVGELQKLVGNEKVQSIKKHVDGIKREFDQKFNDLLENKKEKFIEGGGNEIDFRYDPTVKTKFNEVYNEYRDKRNRYYKSLEKNLKTNLSNRLAIIEELKGLTSVEENMGSTYKSFKDLQVKWHNAGPIPRDSYNTVWRTYRHHTEIFYDYLHLNREMRDFDFKRNLEEKEKLVERAVALAKEPDLNRVFRELQALHKIWKEDIGPVGQAKREEIWERFSSATKVLHQRRQEYDKVIEETYEKNLRYKLEIIASISTLAENVSSDHRELQKQMKQLEVYRKAFFDTGKVPRSKNQKTWSAFKDAVRSFNRNKNAYYKNLKQEEQTNLDKKRELIDLAHTLKDSDDFDTTTPKMKRIQADWKKIGHVPRKYSDKIWKEFKNACDHYFDRIHTLKDKEREEEEGNFQNKSDYIEKITAFELIGEHEADLQSINSLIEGYKTLGRVRFKKKNIDQKFNAAIDFLFGKLGLDPQEVELLKYGNKIQQLADSDNESVIQNERSFIRTKIDETNSEIRQLENNMQFFSNASDDNPLLQDVVKRIDAHKSALATWKSKLKELNILKNTIQKKSELALEASSDSDSVSEEA